MFQYFLRKFTKPGVASLKVLDSRFTKNIEYRSTVLSHEVSLHVCRMLSRRTNNLPHVVHIRGTLIKMAPFCSVYQKPSYVPNCTLLIWFSPRMAHLRMLFSRPELPNCQLNNKQNSPSLLQLVLAKLN